MDTATYTKYTDTHFMSFKYAHDILHIYIYCEIYFYIIYMKYIIDNYVRMQAVIGQGQLYV